MHFRDLIDALARIPIDYREGLIRIDREFDEACERVRLSIAEIRRESTKHSGMVQSQLSQEMELRHQLDKIEQEITRAEEEIAHIDQGITAIDTEIQTIKKQKKNLERQIANRWIIQKIFYLFAEDKDKQRCDQLQTELSKQSQNESDLKHIRRKFEDSRLQTVSRKQHLERQLQEIRQKRDRLQKSVEFADSREQDLVSKYKEAELRRAFRKDNLLKSLSVRWEKAAEEIRQQTLRIRCQQPAFVDLGKSDLWIASEMPKFLILGDQQVSFKNFHCSIPQCIPFPFEHALVLPEDNELQHRLMHHLLLRLLQAIPPGRLEIALIDPRKLGKSFAPFLPLLKVEQLVLESRVLTRADEIERVLGKLTDDVEELIQHRFKGRISSWAEFNAAHPDAPLRYKVVLLFDVPEQLSDKSLWYLERLVENAPRCGILPIIAVDGQRIEDRRYQRLHDTLHHATQRLDTLLCTSDKDREGLSFTYQPEEWPSQEVLDRFLARLAKQYAQVGTFNKSLRDLWADYTSGHTTVHGFEIPIGWTPTGEKVWLTLGSTTSEHHALLAGKTGSGKSNLLHVIIHSLCEKYPPQEVDLYLLDYKESTEFTVYAKPLLPHARLVSTESDPEYGVTVLQHLVDELERRARRFKSTHVRDFAEYRDSSKEQLPRVLLIIDEFQLLFTEERQTAESAEKLLSQLLKQGRSFGIHVLLSTQTLKGINLVSLGGLLSQLGCRIALACSPEDSAMILSSNNWAAADLKSPPEGIINNANGAKSGNIKFLVPLVERTFCIEHLRQLSERAAKRGIKSKAQVFHGVHLPSRPTLDEFRKVCHQGQLLLLGERLTFAGGPVVVPLIERPSFNVLFSGYNDEIHDGMLVSMLTSMFVGEYFDEIVYFNGRGHEPGRSFKKITSMMGERFKAFKDIGELPLQEIADAIGKRRIALVIDGLDAEKALHPAQTFKGSKPGEPMMPADLLKRIAEEGNKKGTFVLTFIDNWRRCFALCKDLLNLFELRVAFCMNEDDAGALVSSGIGKFRGIEKPNRAVFVNRMENKLEWFRPYIDARQEMS